MTNVVSLSRFQPRRLVGFDARELSRKLELIEDRPDSVLTWADVARHARALWRRVDPSSPGKR